MDAKAERNSRMGRFARALGGTVVVGVLAVPLLAGPASAATFLNATAVATETPATAGPYKSVPQYPTAINVSGLTGTVSDVNVTLNDFGARPMGGGLGFAEDADILLEAPNGTNLLLMSDIGGDNLGNGVNLSGVDITIDDAAPAFLPADTVLTSNTAISGKPTDDDNDPDEGQCCSPADPFSNDAADGYGFAGPTASGNTALSAFNGLSPNGTWELYVVDDFGGPERIELLGGWTLNVTTGGGGGGPATPIAVFRPSNSTWYTSGGGVSSFGTTGDIQVPGDYDGNGTQDRAVFRPSTGFWFVQGGQVVQFGTSGDVPVPADYDGNGTTDIAVFRPSTGFWFVRNGATTQFGTNGDIPVPGDYNGNGSDEFAVFRPSTSTWFVQGGPALPFGTTGDIPVPADYNGNGSTDIAVFRPSTGFWFVQGGAVGQFGTNGDIPVPGDYDGNGTASFAVFRPSTGLWFVQGSPAVQFGANGDRPLPLPAAIQSVFFP